MKRLLIAAFSIFALLMSAFSMAGQSKDIGTLEVHYSAFPSTFIPASIAKTYGIQRSRYNAVINISVLDKSRPGKPAVSTMVDGIARNLLGTTKKLSFREVREGNAIYYLAEVGYANEETFNFEINVNALGLSAGKLNFKQKFYTDG
ncbi:hypothetical protein CS022_16420 [Veronia nyctiphanis]|uniref:DUF4426 domain-containing protein n=1 Tax=Veronia nyctiphanis TaxID=1278244 RepID=A0A4Q0YT34_9GAMM|nr:DUF4426 domain-containing protein [Veronia nyctiphanis]RXJ72289.1 hypothetical protein CS022_16420 [Veronia nyctiphanis]